VRRKGEALSTASLFDSLERDLLMLNLESPAFAPGAAIPRKFTCDGSDLSPALAWSDAPPATKFFALTCDDPDAPVGTWTHWVIYSIPGKFAGLPEGVPKFEALPDGTKQGKNSWGKIGYGGPCPPRGKPHRYFFHLYALNGDPGLGPGATKVELETAIHGKVLGRAELMGTYGRA
jgi:Raf kinase inhibitor-like YbhB/YbcL family protein